MHIVHFIEKQLSFNDLYTMTLYMCYKLSLPPLHVLFLYLVRFVNPMNITFPLQLHLKVFISRFCKATESSSEQKLPSVVLNRFPECWTYVVLKKNPTTNPAEQIFFVFFSSM